MLVYVAKTAPCSHRNAHNKRDKNHFMQAAPTAQQQRKKSERHAIIRLKVTLLCDCVLPHAVVSIAAHDH